MNKFYNRPIAPHLTVYTPQISSLFSIWHRITSIYIIIYILLSVCSYKFFFFLNSQFFTTFFYFGYISNYILFLSLYYHLLNGLRHILWDLGLFLTKDNLIKSSFFIIAIVIIKQISFLKNYLM